MFYKQRGDMSITQIILLFVFVAFATVMIMRLLPVYMDNGVVKKALVSFKDIPEMDTKRDSDIHKLLLRYLSLQRVEIFTRETIKEHVDIQRFDDGLEITVTYQTVVPFAANVFLLVKFENSIELP